MTSVRQTMTYIIQNLLTNTQHKMNTQQSMLKKGTVAESASATGKEIIEERKNRILYILPNQPANEAATQQPWGPATKPPSHSASQPLSH